MDIVLCCCAPCKPRYKRLVDAIYPRSLTEGLINSNMQKLTFYTISRPEKLDRVGAYIVSRLSRSLYHQRYNQVKISVEAMDQLLQSCHDLSSLAQFIVHFLKMLQKLFETNDFRMEKLATDSFVNFANIEENTPAYRREYDFFISKFAAMCHSNSIIDGQATRYNGLRGLRGVLWKSSSDPLQAGVWEKENINKIILSILFNLQGDDEDSFERETDENAKRFSIVNQPYIMDGVAETPRTLADQLLRELMAKASFSLISVINPVLSHCDSHKKWEPPSLFSIYLFRAIMYSIKDPSIVIQALITHLDSMSNSDASVRIGIATVLSSIVSIAGSSIGPSLLGIFSSFLKHLRGSVEFQQADDCCSVEDEKVFQETLIIAMSDYANSLPDYQKVEIMMYIVGNIPKSDREGRILKPSDAFLQNVLIKTLLKIATKYKTAYLSTMFSESFLGTMIQSALGADPCVRLDAQFIFHSLLDRHDNLKVLQHLPYVDVADLQLKIEKTTRADQMFMRKKISLISNMLYRSVWLVPEDDTQEAHMDAILCTMALLCVEVGCDEVIIELFRLSFALQSMALEPSFGFSGMKRIAIHNLVAKYLNFSSQLMAVPSMCQHVKQIVLQRALRTHPSLNLLSKSQSLCKIDAAVAPLACADAPEQAALWLEEDASLLFDKADVSDMLKACGKNVSSLSVPFMPKGSTVLASSFGSTLDWQLRSTDKTDNGGIDESTISIDMSIDWSPPDSVQTSRKNTIFMPFREKDDFLPRPFTVKELRKNLNSVRDISDEEEREQKRTQEIITKFRTENFCDLVDEIHQENEEIDLSRTISRLIQRSDESSRTNEIGYCEKTKNIFELTLPESFVY